jgi:hypothetical protein
MSEPTPTEKAQIERNAEALAKRPVNESSYYRYGFQAPTPHAFGNYDAACRQRWDRFFAGLDPIQKEALHRAYAAHKRGDDEEADRWLGFLASPIDSLERARFTDEELLAFVEARLPDDPRLQQQRISLDGYNTPTALVIVEGERDARFLREWLASEARGGRRIEVLNAIGDRLQQLEKKEVVK